MNNIYTIIENAKIPNQLKLYFNDSDNIKEFLNEEKISILEDLTIYFYSIYTFDTPQFCASVVSAFRNSKDVDSFYYLLKRAIEFDLKLVANENSLNCIDEYQLIKRSQFNTVFKEATVLFIESIENLLKNEPVNISLIYIHLGKIDLIIKNTNDSYFIKLRETAEYIISKTTK